jgi:hypothetical protein
MVSQLDSRFKGAIEIIEEVMPGKDIKMLAENPMGTETVLSIRRANGLFLIADTQLAPKMKSTITCGPHTAQELVEFLCGKASMYEIKINQDRIYGPGRWLSTALHGLKILDRS